MVTVFQADAKPAIISTGDTPEGTSWKLINADVLAGLALLEPESVDCVVTSPPYFWLRDYGVEGQIGLETDVKGYVDALTKFFNAVFRVLKPRGSLFLNLGDTYYSGKGESHGKDIKKLLS